MDAQLAGRVAAMRSFNRFYTGVIGLLNEHVFGSPFTLLEARVLYELHTRGGLRPTDMARDFGMDPAQLSRLAARMRKLGLVVAAPNPDDGRGQILRLTDKGHEEASRLDAGSADQVARLLKRHALTTQERIVTSMRSVSTVLSDERPAPVLRGERIGELGELIARQGRLYHDEFGWNADFEGLIAEIYAEYQKASDRPPKRLWIAEIGGEIAGSVFILPAKEDGMAQLRMLYVEPWTRGAGIGRMLVDEAVSFSRASGYRGVMLWTQSCLTAARRIYDAAGFRLESENDHHAFGKDLVGQYLRLDFD